MKPSNFYDITWENVINTTHLPSPIWNSTPSSDLETRIPFSSFASYFSTVMERHYYLVDNPLITSQKKRHVSGIPTGDVLIFAHRRLSTLTQYLTWFGKLPTSTGEAIALYRERTRFTTIEEEESSPLWQLSTSLYFSLFSAAMAATAGCLGSPLSPTFLTSLALLSLSQLSHFAL